MPDARALLAGKDVVLDDGVYHERAEIFVSAMEEWLRAWSAKLAALGGSPAAAP